MNYLFAAHQPLIVRIALLFRPAQVVQLSNGWTGRCKELRGKKYFLSLNKSTPAGGYREVPAHIPERA